MISAHGPLAWLAVMTDTRRPRLRLALECTSPHWSFVQRITSSFFCRGAARAGQVMSEPDIGRGCRRGARLDGMSHVRDALTAVAVWQ